MRDDSSSAAQGQIHPGQPPTMNLIGSTQTWKLYDTYSPQIVFFFFFYFRTYILFEVFKSQVQKR